MLPKEGEDVNETKKNGPAELISLARILRITEESSFVVAVSAVAIRVPVAGTVIVIVPVEVEVPSDTVYVNISTPLNELFGIKVTTPVTESKDTPPLAGVLTDCNINVEPSTSLTGSICTVTVAVVVVLPPSEIV